MSDISMCSINRSAEKIIVTIFMSILFCICNGNADNKDKTNLELIRNCIRQFILQNSDNDQFSKFSLTPECINGVLKKRKDGIWFLGNWTIEGPVAKPVACYSVHHTKAISSELILKLTKKEYGYEILKIELREIFRTYEK